MQGNTPSGVTVASPPRSRRRSSGVSSLARLHMCRHTANHLKTPSVHIIKPVARRTAASLNGKNHAAGHAPESVTPVGASGIETRFDAVLATKLALREKQIQQNYRPVVGIHKWFARRPGSIFRSLLLAEYGGDLPLSETYWKAHQFSGIIADPFMGGGTPVFEANRLGFHTVGCDINPMAFWIVKQSLTPLDIGGFQNVAAKVIANVESQVGDLYKTKCTSCGNNAGVKYFLWVKTAPCPFCNELNDLFPGYRLAEAERHPRHVLVCAECGALNEFDKPPTLGAPKACKDCGHKIHIEGNVSRKKLDCRRCNRSFSFETFSTPPQHRMWAIEYNCVNCYSEHEVGNRGQLLTLDRSCPFRSPAGTCARP